MSQGVGKDKPDRDGPTYNPKTIEKFFKVRPSLDAAKAAMAVLGGGDTGLSGAEEIANQKYMEELRNARDDRLKKHNKKSKKDATEKRPTLPGEDGGSSSSSSSSDSDSSSSGSDSDSEDRKKRKRKRKEAGDEKRKEKKSDSKKKKKSKDKKHKKQKKHKSNKTTS